MTSVRAVPSTAFPGTVELSWTVRNVGDQATTVDGWRDDAYFSFDDRLDDGDVYLGSWWAGPYAPLVAGASYTMTRVAGVPAAMRASGRVLVVTDGHNVQPESDESNNLRAARFDAGLGNDAGGTGTPGGVTLLPGGELTPLERSALRDGLTQFLGWSRDLAAYGAPGESVFPLATVLPGGATAPRTLAQLAATSGNDAGLAAALKTSLVDPLVAFLNGPGTKTVAALQTLLDDLPATPAGSVTSSTANNELVFRVGLASGSAPTDTRLVFDAQLDSPSVRVELDAAVAAAGTVTLSQFEFGLDLLAVDASAPVSAWLNQAFFVRPAGGSLATLGVSASAGAINAAVDVGFFEGRVLGGSASLSASASLALLNPDGDTAGRITLGELIGTPLTDLVVVTPSMGTAQAPELSITLPISGSLGGYALGVGPGSLATVRVTDTSVLDAAAPSIAGTGFNADVPLFSAISASDWTAGLSALASAFGQIGQSGTLQTDLPLLGTTETITASRFSDLVDFGKALQSRVLAAVQGVPQGSTQAQPLFTTAQGFGRALAQALGVGEAAVSPAYDPATNRLTFAIAFTERLVDTTLPLSFDLDLKPFGGWGTAGQLSVTAEGRLQFTLGVDLTPLGEFFRRDLVAAGYQSFGEVPLALLNGGRGVRGPSPYDSVNESGEAVQLEPDGLPEIRVFNRAGQAATVLLDGVSTVGALVARLNSALATIGVSASAVPGGPLAGATDLRFGLRLDDASQGSGPLRVEGFNGSLAVLDLGLTTGDDDGDGRLLGAPLHGESWSGRLFVRDAQLTGSVRAGNPVVNGQPIAISSTLTAGFLGLQAGNAQVDLRANVAGQIADLGEQDGVTFLSDLLSAGASAFVGAGLSGSATLTLGGLAVVPAAQGISAGPGAQIVISLPDITRPTSLTFTSNAAADRLLDFRSLTLDDSLTLLRRSADYLTNVVGVQQLSQRLPIIDKSIVELLNQTDAGEVRSFVDQVRAAIDAIRAGQVGSLQGLQAEIQTALGTPGQNATVSFSSQTRLLDIQLDFARTYAGSTPLGFSLGTLNIPGLGDVLEAGGAGSLSYSASVRLDLDLAIDLRNPAQPQLLIRDTTGFVATVLVESNDLRLELSAGPLGLYAGVPGDPARIAVNSGTAGQPASFNVGVVDEATPGPDGLLGYYPLVAQTGVAAVPVSVAVVGRASATLPLYYRNPISGQIVRVDPATPNLQITATSLLSTPTITAPNLGAIFSNFDPGIDFSGLGEGLEGLIDQVDSFLRVAMLAKKLPVVGDRLDDVLDVFRDLRSALATFKSELSGQTTWSVDTVRQRLASVLAGAGLLRDTRGPSGASPDGRVDFNDVWIVVTRDASNAVQAVDFDLTLGQSLVIDQRVDFDVGLPALGLSVDAGTVRLAAAYQLRLPFGLSRSSGFYISTNAGSGPEFLMSVDASIPGLTATGRLGFLQVQVQDRATAPTRLNAGFSVDVRDVNSDGRLTLTELRGARADLRQVLVPSLSGAANINLTLRTGFGSSELPSILADLGLSWGLGWDFSSGLVGSAPTATFGNVRLDIGSFISGVAGPVVRRINDVVRPIQPVINVLTQRIPVISTIMRRSVTLLDLAQWYGGNSAAIRGTRQFVEAVSAINRVLPGLASSAGSGVYINLGSFNVGAGAAGSDLRSLGSLAGVPLDLRNAVQPAAIASQLSGGQASAFFSAYRGLSGGGFSFPIIESASQAFGLLLGQDATLFSYTTPKLDAGFTFSQFFPVLGPLGARFTAALSVTAQFTFGYDTFGMRRFAASGYADFGAIARGFFVSDVDAQGRDVPEVAVRGRIMAAGELNLDFFIGRVRAGVEGGLAATIAADLNGNIDDGDGDRTKVRVTALGSAGFRAVQLSGELAAELNAYLNVRVCIGGGWFKVCWTLFDKSWRLAKVTLLSFNTGGGGGAAAPQLASLQGGVLTLSMTGGNDSFGVRQSGSTVTVSAFDRSQTFTGVSRIVASGGAGDDSLSVSAEGNAIATIPVDFDGGDGNDRLSYSGRGAVSFSGGAGADVLEVSGLNGLPATGDVSFTGGAGNDRLRYIGDGRVTANGGDGDDYLASGGGNDTLDGGWGNDSLDGGAGADVLTGGPSSGAGPDDDLLTGDSGDDVLIGGVGNDTVDAGEGVDWVIGGAGDDVLDGGDGSDVLWGDDVPAGVTGWPQFVVLGGMPSVPAVLIDGLASTGPADGADVITGGADASVDWLFGAGGDDLLNAGAGNDHVDGGSGADTLRAGLGDDRVLAGGGNDLVTGGSGNDVIDGQGGDDDLSGGLGPDAGIVDGSEARTGNDTIRGGAGNDRIDGGDGDDVLEGNDGVDTVIGGSGTDTLRGGGGDDRLYAGLDGGLAGDALPNTVEGGDGADTIYGDRGADTLYGHSAAANSTPGLDDLDGADRILAGPGADSVWGQKGEDVLSGDAGDDVLSGGADADTVSGGDGNDVISGGAGDDRLDGGDGSDQISGDAGNDVIHGGRGNDNVGSGLVGGSGNDVVRGGFGADLIDGGTGADTLYGGNSETGGGDAFPNTIFGGDDVDLIVGDAGPDTIDAGAGADAVFGLDGNDSIQAGPGDDIVFGGRGGDSILGGDGADSLYAGRTASGEGDSAANTLDGGNDGDSLFGDAGPDVIRGQAGNDFIYGRGGDDVVLEGGAGDDRIFGDGGNDKLFGGPGKDVLDGGAGRDEMTGGSDADRIVLDPTPPVGGSERVLSHGVEDAAGTATPAGTSNSTDTDILQISSPTGNGNDTLTIGRPAGTPLSTQTAEFVFNGQSIPVEWREADGTPRFEQFQIDLGGGTNVVEFLSGTTDRLDLDYLAGDVVGAGGVVLRPFYKSGLEMVSVVLGGPGTDLIVGSAGRDYLIGGEGDDYLFGLAGDDRLWGDKPADGGTSSSGPFDGNDFVYSGVGNDDLFGQGGNDTLFAGDRVTFGGVAGRTESWLFTTSRASLLAGSLGSIDMVGAANAADQGLNRVHGGAGDDRLYGGFGVDFLYGGDRALAGLASEADRLYDRQNQVLTSEGQAEGWLQYAKGLDRAWYFEGTEANEEFRVDYVTSGTFANNHVVTVRSGAGTDIQFRFALDAALPGPPGSTGPAWPGVTPAVSTDARVGAGLQAYSFYVNNDFDVIVIDAGAGDDTILVTNTVRKSVWAAGAEGNDRINLSMPNATVSPDEPAAPPGFASVRAAITPQLRTALGVPSIAVERANVGPGGAQALGYSDGPSLSADGRYVAFSSSAPNLGVGAQEVLVRDRITGQLSRASVGLGGAPPNGYGTEPSISADGRFVAFTSFASNLVNDDTNGAVDVFVTDLQTRVTTRVNLGAGGVQSIGGAYRPLISADGRAIVFTSQANDLVGGDTNNAYDVFVHDRTTGVTTRVNVGPGGSQSLSFLTGGSSISADGRFVAFASDAADLVPGDTNGASDVFVHDRQTGQTTRVSVATGGVQASSSSSGGAISADGRYVAFGSIASNLVAGDTNGTSDIFLHDRQSGETRRLTFAAGGGQASGASYSPVMSWDARYVVFASDAPDLVAGDTNGTTDVFLLDRQTGRTVRINLGPGGAQSSGYADMLSISADGRFAAFRSSAVDLVAGDTNNQPDVFVFDRNASPSADVDDRIASNWLADITSRRDVAVGGPGNDIISGGPSEDWIFGSAGDDVLFGGLDAQWSTDASLPLDQRLLLVDRSDLIEGGAGDDVFQIIPQDRTISSNAYDELYGGPGRDQVLYTGLYVGETADDVPDYVALGFDAATGPTEAQGVYQLAALVRATGATGRQFVASPAGQFATRLSRFVPSQVELMVVDGRGGDDWVFAGNPATGSPGLPASPGALGLSGSWGLSRSTRPLGGGIPQLLILGGDGADNLFGSPFDDSIYGEKGSGGADPNASGDYVVGLAGSDLLSGDGDPAAPGVADNDFVVGDDNDVAATLPAQGAALRSVPSPTPQTGQSSFRSYKLTDLASTRRHIGTDAGGLNYQTAQPVTEIPAGTFDPQGNGLQPPLLANRGRYLVKENTPLVNGSPSGSQTFDGASPGLSGSMFVNAQNPVRWFTFNTMGDGGAAQGDSPSADRDRNLLRLSPDDLARTVVAPAISATLVRTPEGAATDFSTLHVSSIPGGTTAYAVMEFDLSGVAGEPSLVTAADLALEASWINGAGAVLEAWMLPGEADWSISGQIGAGASPSTGDAAATALLMDRRTVPSATGSRQRITFDLLGAVRSALDSGQTRLTIQVRTSSPNLDVTDITKPDPALPANSALVLKQDRAGVVADVVDTNGRIFASGAASIDLRNLRAGTYYLKVYNPRVPPAPATAPKVDFAVEIAPPAIAAAHPATFRDTVDGGPGADRSAGGIGLDRMLDSGPQDTVVAEPVEQLISGDFTRLAPTQDSELMAGEPLELDPLVGVGFDIDAAVKRLPQVGVGATPASVYSFSEDPAISSDGRFVVFASSANNLVANDTNGVSDVFVKDLTSGVTTRVSVPSGGGQASSDSYSPSISTDGRFVAFQSYASNLVSGDTNGVGDIFVHDRQTGQTARVSVATGGAQATGTSSVPAISADGRYVAFDSYAADLVSGDTNNASDIFVHDRQTGQTTRVSVATGGGQGTGYSQSKSISADGRFVAFDSYSPNLVAGDTNNRSDVFVHDRQTGQTTRVSVATGGAQASFSCFRPSISADGRFVAFYSSASNLVTGDTNSREDVFVHDRQTGQTTRVSVATGGAQANDSSYYPPAISPDGRFVAFSSNASNLVTGDTNGSSDVFVHDRQTGQTTRVSVSTAGAQATNGSNYVSISADGRVVAFQSYAPNLVLEGTSGSAIFVHDRQSAATTLASGGVRAAQPGSGYGSNDFASAVSADGQVVAFETWAELVPNDRNRLLDIYLYDRRTLQLVRVSGASGSNTSQEPQLNRPSLSADGRFVAFQSNAPDLVPNDTNNADDIYVFDRQTSQTTRVSVATGGTQATGSSYAPSISADGRFVAFASFAPNVVTGDTNNSPDVFVHDRQTGQTTRVSVATGGAQAINGYSLSAPSISADGRFVAFETEAANLVAADTNNNRDVFVHDRQTGQTTRVSVATGGGQAAGQSFTPSISADGRFVAFTSDAANLVAGDSNFANDIFVHDRKTGQTSRVSFTTGGAPTIGASDSPSISADGRFITYNGASSASPTGRGVFLYDRVSGATVEINPGPGRAANAGSISPSLSQDGRFLAFGFNGTTAGAVVYDRTLATSTVVSVPTAPTLRRASELAAITRLDLSAQGLTSLQDLRWFSGLRHLSLAGNALNAQSQLDFLSGAGRPRGTLVFDRALVAPPRLESLSLALNPQADPRQLGAIPTLRRLDVDLTNTGAGATRLSLPELLNAVAAPGMEQLSAWGVAATVGSAGPLMQSLRVLDVSRTSVVDASLAAALPAVQTFRSEGVATGTVTETDTFPGTALSSAWTVGSLGGATAWTSGVAGGRVNVTSITSPLNTGTTSIWGEVGFTRQLASPLGDFDASATVFWGNAANQVNTDMQRVILELLDASGNVVGAAGYADEWVGFAGGRYGAAGGTSTGPTQATLPLAGSALVRVRRTGSSVTASFDGTDLITASSAAPVSAVRFRVGFFNFRTPQSTFQGIGFSDLAMSGVASGPPAELNQTAAALYGRTPAVGVYTSSPGALDARPLRLNLKAVLDDSGQPRRNAFSPTSSPRILARFDQPVFNHRAGQVALDPTAINITVAGPGNPSPTVTGLGTRDLVISFSQALAEGQYTVTWNTGPARTGLGDEYGNSLAATESLTFTVDRSAPSAALVQPTPGTALRTVPASVEVQWTDAGPAGIDPAEEFGLNDITINGLTPSTFLHLGNGRVRYGVPAALAAVTDGVLDVRAASGGVRDRADNAAPAGSLGSLTIDNTRPTAALVFPAPGAIVAVAQSTLDVAWDSTGGGVDPSTLGVGDLVVQDSAGTVAIAGAATLAPGGAYRYPLARPLAEGTVTVTLVAGAAADRAGNANAAATLGTFRVDRTAPSGSVAAQGQNLASDPGYVDVRWSDAVAGVLDSTIGVDDITVASGQNPPVTVTAVQPSPAGVGFWRYFYQGPLADGPVTVRAVAGAVGDAAGNVMAADVIGTYWIDRAAPTATLASPAPGQILGAVPASIDVRFLDGAGAGIDPASVTAAAVELGAPGLTLGAPTLRPDGAYRFPVTGAFAGGAVEVRIGPSPARDLAGNAVAATVLGSFWVDTQGPTFALLDPGAGARVSTVVNLRELRVRIQDRLGGSVDPTTVRASDFVVSDNRTSPSTPVAVTSVTLAPGSADVWILTLNQPLADGPVALRLSDAAGIRDSVGNAATPGVIGAFVVDRAGPQGQYADAPGRDATQDPGFVDVAWSDPSPGSGLDRSTIGPSNVVVVNPANGRRVSIDRVEALPGGATRYYFAQPLASLGGAPGVAVSLQVVRPAGAVADLAGNTSLSETVLGTLVYQAGATVNAWDGGGGDALWTNPLNWSVDRVPSSGDEVRIPTGAAVIVPESASALAVQRLVVQGSLELRGNLAVADSVTVGGVLIVRPSVQLGVGGDLTLTGSARLEISIGASTLSAGRVVVGGTASLGGRLVVASAAATPTRGERINFLAASSVQGAFSSTSTTSASPTERLRYEAIGSTLSLVVRARADYTDDGVVDLFDIFGYLENWFAGRPDTDFNGDGTPDLLDIYAFLETWFLG